MPSPDGFVKEMTEHWRSLGNKETLALQKAWREMARQFNRHIWNDGTDEPKPWTILTLPTGTGKTEGLCLYCFMRGKAKSGHPGILIVTRLKAQAKEIQDKINERFDNQPVAFAYNGDTKGETKAEKKEANNRRYKTPYLIVTHNAFTRAMKSYADGDSFVSNWDYFTHWSGGARQLVVIDEALDVTEIYHVAPKDLRLAEKMIPSKVTKQHPAEMAVLNKMVKNFSAYAKSIKIGKKDKRLIEPHQWSIHEEYDFKSFFKTLDKEGIVFSARVENGKEISSRKVRDRFENVIYGVEAMLTGPALYSKYKQHTFSAARLILPRAIKKAVVLDATAWVNPVYRLMNNVVDIPALPDGMRNYKNVTLYVHHNHDVGKQAVLGKDDKHFNDLTDYLSDKIGDHKSVLFCVHKDAKPQFEKHMHKFNKPCLANWGAIDGKNDWSECDKLVVYGLSYRKPVDPTLTILAFQQWKNQFREEKKRPELTGQLSYLSSVYAQYQIVVNLVQAMNRVRCRKVTGSKGGCKKTDIYLFLNTEKSGMGFIEPIKQQMPGIEVEYLNDAPTVKVKKDRSPYGRMIIDYLTKQPPSEYPVKELQEIIGFSTSALRRLLAKNKNGESWFAKELRKINVTYHAVQGRPKNGDREESCFIKAGRRKRT